MHFSALPFILLLGLLTAVAPGRIGPQEVGMVLGYPTPGGLYTTVAALPHHHLGLGRWCLKG